MAVSQDCLIEIGVEELPSGSVPKLVEQFAELMTAAFTGASLSHQNIQCFTTPRRIALKITELQTEQADQVIQKRGPAVDRAFDDAGNPSKAALGFARSCKVEFDQLEKIATDNGEYLSFLQEMKGQTTQQLLPGMIQHALEKLPLPKRMRWGEGEVEFIRPIHWLCCLLGKDVVEFDCFAIQSDRLTYGHRFHHRDAISISHPSEYESSLANTGYVIADWQQRRQLIVDAIQSQTKAIDAVPVCPDALLDEVTNLVEWPVVLIGDFDAAFLAMPGEVLCAVMNDHQKCFALQDKKGQFIAKFAMVSNIESQDPQRVLDGNHRVMQARMADGDFFFEADKKRNLPSRVEDLKSVLYVRELGTLFDKAERLSASAKWIAAQLGADKDLAAEAGMLAKTDLLTDMVGEFPELQGLMGYYYATESGMAIEVATALRDQYRPDGQNSPLPETSLAASLALADKIDVLIGIFGINKQPTGDKDPFATRRAAAGVVRIILEQQLDIDLLACLQQAKDTFTQPLANKNVVAEVMAFIQDRLRAWYQAKEISVDTLNAVLAKEPHNLLDLDKRIQAVNIFRQMSEATSLAAANKRVSRILMKEKVAEDKQASINASLFDCAEEETLAQVLEEKALMVQPFLQARDYTKVLRELSSLQTVIDDFFDNVMVMDDDPEKRANRLAILCKLRLLFLEVADISLLQ